MTLAAYVSATQLFAWQGFSLDLPTDWNLATHHGDAKTGAVTLADLRGPRLTVRWQTARAASRRFETVLRGLETKGARIVRRVVGVERADGVRESAEVRHKTFAGRLILAGRRIYEADLVAGGPMPLLCDHAADSDWRWALYGINVLVPRALKLTRAALRPGGPQLTFRRFATVIEAGAWPLADRLLNAQELDIWGRAAVAALRLPGVTMIEKHAAGVRFRVPGKMCAGPTELTLAHDDIQNVIAWTRRRWVE